MGKINKKELIVSLILVLTGIILGLYYFISSIDKMLGTVFLIISFLISFINENIRKFASIAWSLIKDKLSGGGQNQEMSYSPQAIQQQAKGNAKMTINNNNYYSKNEKD